MAVSMHQSSEQDKTQRFNPDEIIPSIQRLRPFIRNDGRFAGTKEEFLEISNINKYVTCRNSDFYIPARTLEAHHKELSRQVQKLELLRGLIAILPPEWEMKKSGAIKTLGSFHVYCAYLCRGLSKEGNLRVVRESEGIDLMIILHNRVRNRTSDIAAQLFSEVQERAKLNDPFAIALKEVMRVGVNRLIESERKSDKSPEALETEKRYCRFFLKQYNEAFGPLFGIPVPTFVELIPPLELRLLNKILMSVPKTTFNKNRLQKLLRRVLPVTQQVPQSDSVVYS